MKRTAEPTGVTRPAIPTDLNARAAAIVARATGSEKVVEKNPDAVALGKLGGAARAAQLKTKRERSEAGRKAVNKRWEAYRQAKAQ